MHVLVDPPPHVLEDEIGLRLAAPDDGWRRRPDMDPHATSLSAPPLWPVLVSSRNLVVEQAGHGVSQYVILGAGLDTFAQRRPEIASGLRIFEVDQPGPQAWKRQRLIELGFGIPEWLRLVPVDFEAGGSWWGQLATAGFDASRPAVAASTGVTMYLTRDATAATLHQIAALAPGSTLAMTFILPLESPNQRNVRGVRQRRKGHEQAGRRSSVFYPAGDAGTGPRSRFQTGPARVGSQSCPALLRGQDGRPSAVKRRGDAGSDDLGSRLNQRVGGRRGLTRRPLAAARTSRRAAPSGPAR